MLLFSGLQIFFPLLLKSIAAKTRTFWSNAAFSIDKIDLSVLSQSVMDNRILTRNLSTISKKYEKIWTYISTQQIFGNI